MMEGSRFTGLGRVNDLQQMGQWFQSDRSTASWKVEVLGASCPAK